MTADTLSLVVEKPAAGGRMIARHDGQVVLVSGAIPGERVTARVEQVRGGVIYAAVVSVDSPSPDRRPPPGDPACGGAAYAHIAYARQCAIKGEVVADAFRRIGRVALDTPVPVRASPEEGYRMRARLHVRGDRVGFFREGTHDVCDARITRQLTPATLDVVDALSARLGIGADRAVRELELTENVPGTERAVLVELAPGSGDAARRVLAALADVPGLTGVIVVPVDAPDRTASRGRPWVKDVLAVEESGAAGSTLALRRHVASFFQGNRYLLESLVQAVLTRIPTGDLVDLYAGAGLFGLAYAARRRGRVVAVEGDRHAAEDLAENARPYGQQVRVVASPVETFLTRERFDPEATLLVDPPRTGLSRVAGERVAASGAARVVYVSCDVATLARDVRRMLDAGFRLTDIEAFDLFPNTPHVETVLTMERA